MSVCEKAFVPLKSVRDVDRFAELNERYAGGRFYLNFENGDSRRVYLHHDAILLTCPYNNYEIRYTFADFGYCVDMFAKPRLWVEHGGLNIDLSPYF